MSDQKINPATSPVVSSETTEENPEETFRISETFDDMDLKPEILRGVYAYGFEKPSLIQQRAVVPFTTGRDLIAQSQSGTGKTGAFTIGLLQRVDVTENSTQILVLAPTRLLAKQIHTVISAIGSHITGLVLELAIGGVRSKMPSRWGEEKCSHIVIGTPGRILDNLQRKRLGNKGLRAIVLDEADEMLSRGFLEQVHQIFQFIPPTCQVALFSATMPNDVLELSHKFMNNPSQLLVKQEHLTLDGIRQFYVGIEKRDHKYDVILDLFDIISVTQCIIYVNTKRFAEDLHECLSRKGFGVGIITGNMTQEERNHVMSDFRSGQTRVLIATDMLARGIDVQQVSLVINFDLPREKETYIHRIGRSGRFGRKGVSINLVTSEEYEMMQELEAFYNTKVEELPHNIGELI